jgi:tRNA 5-methylaminomethyl-2-thiouridine biosynthesis bifunctional protein
MTSVIIIGGGISGCSTAYAFSQRNAKVTMIERHNELAQEASGNPISVLYPKLSLKPTAQSALQLQGFEFVVNLIKKISNESILFEPCGLIQLAYNPREVAKHSEMKSLADFQLLDSQQASIIAGIALKVGGLYLPHAGWIYPRKFCEFLCHSSNITKITSTEALKIEKSQHGWDVCIVNNQKIHADIVVVCCANEVKQFSQCASIKITPVRGQVNFFTENSTSQKLKTIISSDHFISPSANGLHSFGTSYSPNDKRQDISEPDTRENLKALQEISPSIFESVKITTGRVSFRSQTLDYMPLAGQLLCEHQLRSNPPRYNASPSILPWLEGLFVNAGHGSKGMITAPICGELIASLAYKNVPNIDTKLTSKLNPSRFLLRELGLKQLAQSLYQ